MFMPRDRGPRQREAKRPHPPRCRENIRTTQPLNRGPSADTQLRRKTRRGPLIDERSPSRLLQRRGQRFVLLAIRAANGRNPAEMIERLLAVTSLELPQPVILPCQDVVRIRLQRALVPD